MPLDVNLIRPVRILLPLQRVLERHELRYFLFGSGNLAGARKTATSGEVRDGFSERMLTRLWLQRSRFRPGAPFQSVTGRHRAGSVGANENSAIDTGDRRNL